MVAKVCNRVAIINDGILHCVIDLSDPANRETLENDSLKSRPPRKKGGRGMSDKINKEALAAHRKKVRDDWFTIRALLKIDMKSRFGYGTRIGAGNVGKWIFNFIMSGLMYAIIVF